jgi:phage terminase Nu1 subunit (DNA packaging protein)
MAQPHSTTQEQFAKLVGISQPEVSQLLRKGVLTRGATTAQWHREYLDNLRKVAAGWQSQSGMLDRIQEAALLDRRKREQIEIKLAESKGDLLPVAAVVEALSFINSAVKSKLLALPNRIRSMNPQMTPRQVDDLDASVREILTELSNVRLPPSFRAVTEQYFSTLHTTAKAKNKRVGRPVPHAQPRK